MLADLGIGIRSGSLTLHTTTGDQVFSIGEAMLLDGKPIECDHPPEVGRPSSSLTCPSWRRDVFVGETRVRESYRATRRPDSCNGVEVADRMQTKKGEAVSDFSTTYEF